MTISATNFHFDSSKMECSLNFRFSSTIDFYCSVIPLSLCLLVSLYTLLRCNYLFKKYPENLTKSLLYEIMLYPLIFLVCNSTSIIQTILVFKQVHIWQYFYIIDQFFEGIQGSLICLVFFWMKLNVRWLGISQILTGVPVFSSPTSNVLKQIERNS